MAKAEVKMPEQFLLRISKLKDKTDEIIPQVLKTGGEIVFKRIEGNLRSVIGRDTKHASRSTGELLSALGISPVKIDRDGAHNLKIGFSEPRPDGESNAKIANIIEYGKSGQPARPFLKPAISATKKKCIDAMTAKLDEEWGKL